MTLLPNRSTRPVVLVVILLVASLLAGCAGKGDSDSKTQVGYYPGALLSLPAFIAQERGFFKDNGLDVELVSIPDGAAMTAAVASRSIDFGNNSYDNLTTSVDKGLPLKAVTGATVKLPLALLARKGTDVPHQKDGYPAAIDDLMGKKWGVIGLGISLQFLAQMVVTEAGHDKDDVDYIAVGLPATARPALKQGKVDTYLSLWPLPAIGEATGETSTVIDFTQDEGPEELRDLNYNGWWANDATIKSDMETVERFTASMEQAYCWYSNPKNLDDVVDVLQKYVPVDDLTDAQYKSMIAGILPAYGIDITGDSIDTWQQILVNNGLIDEPLSRDDLVASTATEEYTCS